VTFGGFEGHPTFHGIATARQVEHPECQGLVTYRLKLQFISEQRGRNTLCAFSSPSKQYTTILVPLAYCTLSSL
jgi:hypothetical protein